MLQTVLTRLWHFMLVPMVMLLLSSSLRNEASLWGL